MYLRRQNFSDLGSESTFLWGARQTGKSTLLKMMYPESLYLDLLRSELYGRFVTNPGLLREIVQASDHPAPVIIDEIQKVPALLNEIHWLITNRNTQFILSGSSPRKILRSGSNLLGGRAMRHELYPLSWSEIPDFDLNKALNSGLLPRHYLSATPGKLISAYLGSYLKDEIAAEAKLRNIAAFARFLEAAAFSNGELLNYSNIASDCGVSSPTIREYFQILEDTLTGSFIQPFQKKPKRKVISAPKFWFFDVGIAGYLLKRNNIIPGSESFGKAFEHFIWMELNAYKQYSGKEFPIRYWRTTSQIEVDFILGDHEVALEVKSSGLVNERHLKGLKTFSEEYTVKKSIAVSTDLYKRLSGNIHILPWQIFLEMLWGGEII